MPVILSMKDRIKVDIGEVSLVLKPLNQMEQGVVNSHRTIDEGETTQDLIMTAFSYVKHSLKELTGVKTHSGEDYKLEFEGNYLTDDCASEVMTLNLGAEFMHLIQRLRYNEVQEKPTYYGSKKELKGIKLEVIAGA